MKLDKQQLRWLRAVARVLTDLTLDAEVIDGNPQAAILSAVSIVLIRKAIGGAFDPEHIYKHLEASAELFYQHIEPGVNTEQNRYLAALVLVAASIIEGLPSSEDEVQGLIKGVRDSQSVR